MSNVAQDTQGNRYYADAVGTELQGGYHCPGCGAPMILKNKGGASTGSEHLVAHMDMSALRCTSRA